MLSFHTQTRIFTTLKGQSNKIFDPHFFHHSNLPGPLTNRLKYFRFWFCFRRDIPIFLNFRWVSYPGESISPGYHTLGSHLTFLYPNQRDSPTKLLNCFLHNSRLPGPLSNCKNIFDFGYDFAELFEFF